MRNYCDWNNIGTGMDCPTKRQRETGHARGPPGQLGFRLVYNRMDLGTVLGNEKINYFRSPIYTPILYATSNNGSSGST